MRVAFNLSFANKSLMPLAEHFRRSSAGDELSPALLEAQKVFHSACKLWPAFSSASSASSARRLF